MNISVRTINGEHKIAFENNKECTIRHPGPKSTVQAPVFFQEQFSNAPNYIITSSFHFIIK